MTITNEQISAEVVRIMDGCQHEDKRIHWWGKVACCECAFFANDTYKAMRKGQLAELPRCEVLGCRARGTVKVAGRMLMCGRHFHKAEAELLRVCGGIPLGIVDLNKEPLIALATAKRG